MIVVNMIQVSPMSDLRLLGVLPLRILRLILSDFLVHSAPVPALVHLVRINRVAVVRVRERLEVRVAAAQDHLLHVVEAVARERRRAVQGRAHELGAHDVEAAQLVQHRDAVRLPLRPEVDEPVARRERGPLGGGLGVREREARRVLRGVLYVRPRDRPLLRVVPADVAWRAGLAGNGCTGAQSLL